MGGRVGVCVSGGGGVCVCVCDNGEKVGVCVRVCVFVCVGVGCLGTRLGVCGGREEVCGRSSPRFLRAQSVESIPPPPHDISRNPGSKK